MNHTVDTAGLAATLDITINKTELYHEALTHRSYLNEHRDYRYPHNERLECGYLGLASGQVGRSRSRPRIKRVEGRIEKIALHGQSLTKYKKVYGLIY